MHDGDNPPIGITHKGKKMVEYALAGMDNRLFVSTYMLQLPNKEVLEMFLLDEMESHDFSGKDKSDDWRIFVIANKAFAKSI